MLIKQELQVLKDDIENYQGFYSLQRQILLKLLSTMILIVDSDWCGIIKVDKDLLHIEDN